MFKRICRTKYIIFHADKQESERDKYTEKHE